MGGGAAPPNGERAEQLACEAKSAESSRTRVERFRNRSIVARRRAEETVRLQASQYATMLATTADGFWRFDTNGKLLEANDSYCRMSGYSRAELMNLRVQDIDAIETPAETARHIQSVKETGFDRFESKHRRKDGSLIDVEISVSWWPEQQQFLHFCRDISEAKRAKEKVREDEAQFRGLVEQEIAGIFILAQDGSVAYLNPLFSGMLGYSPGEVLGRPFMDFIPASEQPQVVEAFASLISGKETSIQMETRILRKEGVPVDILAQGRLASYRGRPAVMGVALDITGRKTTERELAFNAAVLTTEHEISPDGILVVDEKDRIVSFNRHFVDMFQIPAELVAARDDAPVLEHARNQVLDPDAFLARVKHLYAHREERGFEHIQLKDGRTFDRYTSPMQLPDGAYLGRIWFFRDITDRLGAQRMLERINRTLKTLSACNEALVRAASEPELLEKMCRVAVESGGYRLAWIGFAQTDEAKTVRPVGWAGETTEFEALTAISWADNERGRGPTGTAIRTGQPQVNQDVETNPAMGLWREAFLAGGYRSSLALPLKDRSGTFGAFTIYSADPDAFNADEVKLLVELATDLSYGINSLRDRVAREDSVQRLRKSLDATVQAIASTLELRDPYTAGHQRNVASLAAAIAREAGIAEDQIDGIYLAGVVHDIGKINVPAEILSKPGKLSGLEFQIVQTHAETGYEIVKGIDFPWPVAETILQHHERLDGSGYPKGLKGDEILPSARIIAIADVVEAMTAHRPYRAALGLDAALAEIERGKGWLYDRAAVEACVKLIRSGAFKLG
jgi:PAS domain S-box-containing protein/putative nucleotidyltransferase with HDIG domain